MRLIIFFGVCVCALGILLSAVGLLQQSLTPHGAAYCELAFTIMGGYLMSLLARSEK